MNKCIYTNIVAFILGAAISAFVTHKVLKKKYEKLADEEIKKVTDELLKKETLDIVKSDKKEPVVPLVNDTPYDGAVENIPYNTKFKAGSGVPSINIPSKPSKRSFNVQKVSLEEYDETTYPTYTLYLYTDGVLADEDENMITDKRRIAGDVLDSISETAGDSIFILNHTDKVAYEILLDERAFNTIKSSNTPTEDDEDDYTE